MRIWPTPVIRWHLFVGAGLAVFFGGALGYIAGAWAAVFGLVVGAGYYVLSTRRYRARKRLVAADFPAAWRTILENKVAFYRRLDDAGKQRFEHDLRIFVAEHRILGLRGAEVRDDVKVLIGASAATLTIGMPDWEWPRMRDIVVYPKSFDDEYATDGGGHIVGMVHAQGAILFSEKDLRLGFARPSDGHNVGLHELAHVMDFVDGTPDGVPAGLDWVSTAPWVELVADRLRRVRTQRNGQALRDYAGTNEAELFAVAVEVFFEQPDKLRDKDPELFEVFKEFFGVDPSDP